jgi:hypothetical protein
MGTQNEIQDYVRRPGRYTNIDGTGEMFFGVMYLGFALHSYLQSILPADSIWTGKNWHQLVFMESVLLAVLGLGWWGTKAIKKHVTHPRTGYVALKTNTWRIVLFMLISAGVAAALAVAVFWLRHNTVSHLRIGVLILYEAPYVILACMSRDHPWKWFVALFMAFGLAAIALTVPGSMDAQFRHIALFLGLTWLASGGITLYLYIRRTHPPAAEPE